MINLSKAVVQWNDADDLLNKKIDNLNIPKVSEGWDYTRDLKIKATASPTTYTLEQFNPNLYKSILILTITKDNWCTATEIPIGIFLAGYTCSNSLPYYFYYNGNEKWANPDNTVKYNASDGTTVVSFNSERTSEIRIYAK